MTHAISYTEFSTQQLEKRTMTTWMQGRLLGSVKGKKISCYLYQLPNFYVELIFSQDKNKVLNTYPFKDELTLSKYLHNINID